MRFNHYDWVSSNTNLSKLSPGIYCCQYLKPEQFDGLDIYSWGTMIVIKVGTSLTQLYLPHLNEIQYIRNGWEGVFRPWRQL